MVDGPPVLMGAPSEPDPGQTPREEEWLQNPSGGGDRPQPRSEIRVLVADDHEAMRDLMVRRIERMGHKVDRARDGQEASSSIESDRYDLIVTDIYKPEVTGLDLLRRAKELDPTVQVVVVTASATLDNVVKALNHGAFAYLTVFDNVVSRAIDFRRALLDNLRMGKVQRRRGLCCDVVVMDRGGQMGHRRGLDQAMTNVENAFLTSSMTGRSTNHAPRPGTSRRCAAGLPPVAQAAQESGR